MDQAKSIVISIITGIVLVKIKRNESYVSSRATTVFAADVISNVARIVLVKVVKREELWISQGQRVYSQPLWLVVKPR